MLRTASRLMATIHPASSGQSQMKGAVVVSSLMTGQRIPHSSEDSKGQAAVSAHSRDLPHRGYGQWNSELSMGDSKLRCLSASFPSDYHLARWLLAEATCFAGVRKAGMSEK